MAEERAREADGGARRAEVDQRRRAHVASVRGGARQAHHLPAVGLVAQEQVAALYLLAQIAEARGAANPAPVAHGVGTPRAGAKILVKAPAALGVDLEDPDFGHGDTRLKPLAEW